MESLVGQKFGRLRAVRFVGITRYRQRYYTCICSCGKRINVMGYDLKRGKTQSCGCLQRERASQAQKERHARNRAALQE